MIASDSGIIQRIADGIGAFGSIVCTVHCLLLPTLLVTGSSLPPLLLNEDAFHWLLLFVVVPSAFIAFFIGSRHHRDWLVLTLGAISLTLFITLATVGHDLFGHDWERRLMVIASLMIVTAHVRNYWLCHRS
ncbi:MAG: MerC domain-containing protein [Pseudomonadota bacterium]